MVPEGASTSTSGNALTNTDFGIGINGLLGGLAGIVFSFIPLAPLLGGVLAGYLEGGSSEAGLKAGGIAGLVMLLPYAFFLLVLLFFLGFAAESLFFGVVILFAVVISALYTVGLSIAGGYLGIYLRKET